LVNFSNLKLNIYNGSISQFRESTINAGSTPPKPEISEQLLDKYLLAADC